MDLTDETIPDSIAACPRLETLVIRRCGDGAYLKVVSQRLKNLSIISCRFYSVEISAPTLRSFRWIDSEMVCSNIKDLDSLVYAEIMFWEMPKYCSCCREMMDAMPHVRPLTCQNLWFQESNLDEILDDMLIGILPHLKKIKIKSFIGMESELFVIFFSSVEWSLEKMTLLTDNDGFNDVPEEPLAARFKELLLFARSSPDA